MNHTFLLHDYVLCFHNNLHPLGSVETDHEVFVISSSILKKIGEPRFRAQEKRGFLGKNVYYPLFFSTRRNNGEIQ